MRLGCHLLVSYKISGVFSFLLLGWTGNSTVVIDTHMMRWKHEHLGFVHYDKNNHVHAYPELKSPR